VEETIEYLMNINSWEQVAVLALILGYLIYRQWKGERKVNRKVTEVKTQVDTTHEAVAGVTSGVEAVLHQVENNSGSSLKDAVDRIETGQAELVELFGEHKHSFDRHVESSEKDSERLAALEAKYLDPTGRHDPGL
jgi:hypothetical protein